jgi:hypothetical protein
VFEAPAYYRPITEQGTDIDYRAVNTPTTLDKIVTRTTQNSTTNRSAA